MEAACLEKDFLSSKKYTVKKQEMTLTLMCLFIKEAIRLFSAKTMPLLPWISNVRMWSLCACQALVGSIPPRIKKSSQNVSCTYLDCKLLTALNSQAS